MTVPTENDSYPRVARPPFAERGGRLRGVLDVCAGRYPRFLYGGGVGNILPAFHFHDVSPQSLQPYLDWLVDNGYSGVTSEEVARFVKEGVHPGPRSVVLCFDDAYASLSSVAFPLLRDRGLRAITYAIPGRTAERSDPESPFVSWPQLRDLRESGTIDVQSHTWSHSQIFCGRELLGFVTPAYARSSVLDRPLIRDGDRDRHLSPADLGAPLYAQRSRMSDAVRFMDDPEVRAACTAHVVASGGPEFFGREDWEGELRRIVGPGSGRWETREERGAAIAAELVDGRRALNERLATDAVRHICFPWGVAGRTAIESLPAAGYQTAFADRLFGYRAVRANGDPYRMMRLPHRYIRALPGQNRRSVFALGLRARS